MSSNVETENNRPYCLAPWVHSHVTMTGQRALCCVAKPFEETFDSFNDYWNSDLIKDIRKTMLTGKAPEKYCQACLKPEVSEHPTLRFEDFNKDRSQFIKQTQTDGEFNGLPSFLDYRLSNLCNLSCRMCSPESSSKIEHAFQKTSPYLIDNALKKRSLTSEWILPEVFKLCEEGPVQQLYFASGEALLQKETWELLTSLRDKGLASGTKLHFHTNLVFPYSRWEGFEETLSSFKETRFTLSIDGTEETAEYIRDGIKWHLFLKNLEYLKSRSPQFIINQVNITLTLPTLLELKSVLKFIRHEKLPFMASICFTDRLSYFHSPRVLPQDIFDKVLRVAQEDLNPQEKDIILPLLQELKLLGPTKVTVEERTQILLEHLKVDLEFKRETFLSYYRQFDMLAPWVDEISSPAPINIYPETAENLFWLDVLNRKGAKGLKLIHEECTSFINHLTFLKKAFGLESKASIIGSYPSLLNRWLSGSDHQKFKVYQEHLTGKGVSITILNPAPFLLRNTGLPKILISLISIMVAPFKRFIALHFYSEARVKDVANLD